MGDGKVLAGWDEGLLGKRVGSQVMLILPPEKAFGAAGKPENGIRGTDTVVIVVDILDSAQATKTP
jgi:peptidylprolyl isomerase